MQEESYHMQNTCQHPAQSFFSSQTHGVPPMELASPVQQYARRPHHTKSNTRYLYQWADKLSQNKIIKSNELPSLKALIFCSNKSTGICFASQEHIYNKACSEFGASFSFRTFKNHIKKFKEALPHFRMETKYGPKGLFDRQSTYGLGLHAIQEEMGVTLGDDTESRPTFEFDLSAKTSQDNKYINNIYKYHTKHTIGEDSESRMTEDDIQKQGATVAVPQGESQERKDSVAEPKPESPDQGPKPTKPSEPLVEVSGFSCKLTSRQAGLWDKMKRQRWSVYPGKFVSLLKKYGTDKALEAYEAIKDTAGVKNPGAYWSAVMDGRVGAPQSESEGRRATFSNQGTQSGKLSLEPSNPVPGADETMAANFGIQREDKPYSPPVCQSVIEKYGVPLGPGGIYYLEFKQRKGEPITPQEAYDIYQSD